MAVSFVKPGITVTEESAKLSQLVETYDLRLFAGGRQCKGRFLGTPSGVPGVKVNGSRIRVDYGVRSPAVLGLGLTSRNISASLSAEEGPCCLVVYLADQPTPPMIR